MIYRRLTPLVVFGFILLIIFIVYAFSFFSKRASLPLIEAQNTFIQATHALNNFDKERDLNDALRRYLSIEERYQPLHGNGKLYQQIGQLYFDLNKYSWAAFYFYQAKALMPRSQEVENQLLKTFQFLNLPSENQKTVFRKVFFFHYFLSIPERLQILCALMLLILVLTSLYIWKSYSSLKGLIAGTFLIGLLFFGSLMYSRYVEPLEGVMIRPSLIYREANFLAPLVSDKPLMEGNKIEVLDVQDQGLWLKIRSDLGLGFVPQPSIRIISR